MDYAHKLRVLHRDIKPGNVMLTFDGKVKVMDFGLAAQINNGFTHVSSACHGTSGTHSYMAPEQWRGTRFGDGQKWQKKGYRYGMACLRRHTVV